VRPSSVLGSGIHEHSGDPAATPALWRAEVLDVDTASSTATVVVPGYSRVRDYDQVPYMTRDATHISPGDDAWVGFDDERSPVIVCWVPA
jgi:hypothetical protein